MQVIQKIILLCGAGLAIYGGILFFCETKNIIFGNTAVPEGIDTAIVFFLGAIALIIGAVWLIVSVVTNTYMLPFGREKKRMS